VFFGASHTRDLKHPQFALLAKIFREMKPEIAFNEGGQLPQERTYPHNDSAVQDGGETGCLKYLCDESRIKMMNGDMENKEEFRAWLKTIPKDQIHLYMATERFLNPFKQGPAGKLMLEAFHEKFNAYLERSEFFLYRRRKDVSLSDTTLQTASQNSGTNEGDTSP
jgi:hypothetical protein